MIDDSMQFFVVRGAQNVETNVRFPLGPGGGIFCKPCKRWYGGPNFTKVEATVSRIREGYYYEGSPAVDVGPDWPEVLDASYRGPLVRGDVVEIMLESGVSGFIPRKVKLTIDDDKAFARPAPEYFHIEITGRIAISFPYDEVIICPICLSLLSSNGQKFGPTLKVPALNTWTGDDLVRSSNVAFGYAFSTRKLIDLARAERWSTFRFTSWPSDCPVEFMNRSDWHADATERVRDYCTRYVENRSGEQAVPPNGP